MAAVTAGEGFAPRLAAIAVNGAVIDRDAIGREAQNHPAATPIASWSAAARALIVRELLVQEGRRLAIEAEPELDAAGRRETPEEAMIRALLDQAVVVEPPDEEACRAYYEANGGRFMSPALYEASHILLPASPADKVQRDAARRKAEDLIAALRRNPDSFAELAALHSACPSGRQGGNLGQISSGQTVPEFEAALERLTPEEISKAPVATRYGFHVIRLDRRIAGAMLPYDAVAGRIATYLGEMAERRAQHSYMRRLAASARIAGFDLETGKPDPVSGAGTAPPEEYATQALERFSLEANDEDWQRLTTSLEGADDPAAETRSRMAAWARSRDAAPAHGGRAAAGRVVFAYSPRSLGEPRRYPGPHVDAAGECKA